MARIQQELCFGTVPELVIAAVEAAAVTRPPPPPPRRQRRGPRCYR